MASARNMVIDGTFKKKRIIVQKGCATINAGAFRKIRLEPKNVAAYEVATENYQKSATSGVARGLIGGALLGPLGALAGGVSGKTKGVYRIIITYHNGAQSLIEVDDYYYNLIVEKLALLQYQNQTAAAQSAPAVEERKTAEAPFSTADEILKYKNLLDTGVITAEEFEKKKQQLLNL